MWSHFRGVKHNAKDIDGFEIKVLVEKEPVKVIILPEGEVVDFKYDGKYVTFKTKTLKIFEMYKIEYK